MHVGSGIFTASDRGMQAGLGDREPYFGGVCRRKTGKLSYGHSKALAIFFVRAERPEGDFRPWLNRSLLYLVGSLALAAPDKFGATIDDHLRCVDALIAASCRVSLLALGPLLGGKWVH